MNVRARATRFLFVILVLALLAPARFGAVLPAARVDAGARIDKVVSDALVAFRARHDVRHARVSIETGRVASLYGDLGSLPVIDAAAKQDDAALSVRAMAFLTDLGPALLDSDASSSLSFAHRTDSALGSRLEFEQHIGQWPVFDARVDVHVSLGGDVFGVTSSLASGLDPALAGVEPVIDESTARSTAMASLGVGADRLRNEDVTPSTLGIAAEGTGALAWRVVVPAKDPYGQWTVLVDAVTGQTIGAPVSMVVSAGTAKVFVPNAVVSTGDTSLRDNSNAASAVPENSYSTVTLQGLDSSGFVSGPFCTTDRTTSRVSASNGDFTFLRRNDRGFNEVEAYWAIDTAQRYIQNQLDINNAANYPIRVNVHAFADDNSNYTSSGGTGVLNFGDGGVDDAQDAEIVWHEYGHAILDNQARISFSGESGAIHEGWGDYVAATLSMTVPGDARFYPTVGEWDATSYDFHDPPYLRRVDGTRQYPQDIVNEVHTDGEIWSSCLYGINQSIGRLTADKLIFNANFLLPTSATFQDGAAAIVEADRQLFGGSHVTAIGAAFADHGIEVVAATPVISSVKRSSGKLTVNGTDFVTGSAVIEINGAQLSLMKYPKKYRRNGVSTRISSKDSDVAALTPGVAVQITVLNPTTGARSAPFAFTP